MYSWNVMYLLKKYSFIICISICLLFYFYFKYFVKIKSDRYNEYIVNKHFAKSVTDYNKYYHNQKDFIMILSVDASIYFERIAQKDRVYIQYLDSNSSVCDDWSSSIKEIYMKDFKKNIEDKNIYKKCLEGLEVVDNICKNRVEINKI